MFCGGYCCILGPRLSLSRALERLTIGLRTTSRVGGIKPSSKVESVVILRYLPTRSVTTLPTRVKRDPKKSARRNFARNVDDNERNHIKTFDCHGNQNTLGLRWKRWLTAFELFAVGKGLILNEDNANNRQRRRALMLHLAGPDVQDLFLTLPNTGDVKDYRKAVDALNAYFAP